MLLPEWDSDADNELDFLWENIKKNCDEKSIRSQEGGFGEEKIYVLIFSLVQRPVDFLRYNFTEPPVAWHGTITKINNDSTVLLLL